MKKLEKALQYAKDMNAKAEREQAEVREACYQAGQEIDAIKAERQAPPYSPRKMAELAARIQALEAQMADFERQIITPGPKLTGEEVTEALRLYNGAEEEFHSAYAAACQGFRDSTKQAQNYSWEAYRLRMAFISFQAEFEGLTGCKVSGLEKPSVPQDFQAEEYATKEERLHFWGNIPSRH